MIGYHYTSLECWEKIQNEGLRPYTIRRGQLLEHIGSEETEGIWLWEERMKGLSHIGSVFYQMAQKGTLSIVYLQVNYDDHDCLSAIDKPEKVIVFEHTGAIENLQYHKGKEEAVIVVKTIPPEQIKLLRVYNLLDAWKGDDAKVS